jgi:hypothetical protein
MLRLIPLVLATACVSEPSSKSPVFVDPEDTVDDPYETQDTAEHSPGGSGVIRPLCQQPSVNATIADDIRAWIDETQAGENRLYGNGRAILLEAMGENNLGETLPEIVENRMERGWQRARLGDIDGAIADLQRAVELTEDSAAEFQQRARHLLAMVWMRKAELDNCVTDKTGKACLIPFDPEGQHQLILGMTEAARVWRALLTENAPMEPVPRYMLNICHMALGDWPDAVEPQWRMGPELLAPEEVMPVWHNVAPDLGLAEPMLAGNAGMEDFDGDGLLDLITSSAELDVSMRLYLANGDGTFCDATPASGLGVAVGGLDFWPADYDNDGDMDVLLTRGAWMNAAGIARPSLLRNDGTGRFVDVAVEAGITNVIGPSQGAAWSDFNGDGWLDLFIGRESITTEAGGPTGPASMYLSQGDGTFIDLGENREISTAGFVKGAMFGDLDEDGDPDLYVSTMQGENHLFINEGGGRFSPFTEHDVHTTPINGFATWMFDYNQDGRLDIFAAAYPASYGAVGPLDPDFGRATEGYISDLIGFDGRTYETMQLYRNTETGFENVTLEVGLDDVHSTMGASFGDMDMDGYPDIYLGTGGTSYDALEPNVAYHNSGGVRFLDVTSAVGMGHLQKGHGVSFGDIDEDGDEDIWADIGGALPADRFGNSLFVNPTNDRDTTTRHTVHLRLEGVTANRSAFGAEVRVVTPGRTFYHWVGNGSSFGANSTQVEVALADETEVQWIEIDWPYGETEIIEAIELDAVSWIRQGEGVVRSRPLLRMGLGAEHLE